MKEQRIVTVFKDLNGPISSFALDQLTKKQNQEGWEVKQVLTASFEKSRNNEMIKFNLPYLAITLLLEKA